VYDRCIDSKGKQATPRQRRSQVTPPQRVPTSPSSRRPCRSASPPPRAARRRSSPGRTARTTSCCSWCCRTCVQMFSVFVFVGEERRGEERRGVCGWSWSCACGLAHLPTSTPHTPTTTTHSRSAANEGSILAAGSFMAVCMPLSTA